MTVEKFLEQIKKLDVSFGYYKQDRWEGILTPCQKSSATIDDFLYEKWVSGGLGGGSCWDTGDTDNHYAVESEREPEFSCLDTVLLYFAKDISFLQYKKLVSDIVKYDEEMDSEYYGNYTNYSIKKVMLKDLYEKMVELELL